MKLKSYFAESVEDAISQARLEMGADALLVNSKRSGPEASHLGAYEVVCAAEAAPESGTLEADFSPVRRPAPSPRIDRLSEDVSELKQQMERLTLTLARSSAGAAGLTLDSQLAKVFAGLTDAELDTHLAYDLVSQIGSPPAAAELRDQFAPMVTVDSRLGRPGFEPRIVALVGPPGAGKTTSLVKLAAQYGITSRKPSQILSVDRYRVGAADQLRSYAAILGIGFQVLETTTALAQALEEHRQKDLILIDTPGLSGSELGEFEDLTEFLGTHPGVDTHLVLPASTRGRDLRRAADQYRVFKPGKLLFTRLDETSAFGPILNESVRMAKPVSFLSRGQRIPEDLEAATTEAIVDLILKPEWFRQSHFGAVAG